MRFKRKPEPKPEDDGWFIRPTGQPKPDDPDYDAMRADKRRIPPPTAKEYRAAAFSIATAMVKYSGYRPWMANTIGPNGERINTEGEVIL